MGIEPAIDAHRLAILPEAFIIAKVQMSLAVVVLDGVRLNRPCGTRSRPLGLRPRVRRRQSESSLTPDECYRPYTPPNRIRCSYTPREALYRSANPITRRFAALSPASASVTSTTSYSSSPQWAGPTISPSAASIAA